MAKRLASEGSLRHLRSLGVTTIELLPIHHIDERFLVEGGRKNYWGYNTIGYFAPEAKYAAHGVTGETMVGLRAALDHKDVSGVRELGGSAAAVPAGAFALVGMGAVLAATTRSPLLAMIMIFELSLDYSLVPPLMLACVVSILVARQLHGESVYMEHMRVKGLALGQETSRPGETMEQTIGDLMRAPVTPVRESTPLREIADRFLTNSNNFLPVVDAQERLLGVVALQDLKEFLNANQDLGAVIAYDVMRPPPKCLTPGQRLLEALPAVLESEFRNVPVVNNPAENKLVGAVVRAEVLAIFSEAIAAKSDPTR